MSVPISLADTNGKLRTGQKAALADVLTRGIECPSAIDLKGSACLLIDGMALVAAVGKPADAQTFGRRVESLTAFVSYPFLTLIYNPRHSTSPKRIHKNSLTISNTIYSSSQLAKTKK